MRVLKFRCVWGVSIWHRKMKEEKKGCSQNPYMLFIISVPDLWFAEFRRADLGNAVLEPGRCILL